MSPCLSFSICGDREEGKDGLRRKDEVCNWCNICGLQGGINVCSLRALSPSSLLPSPFHPSISPGSERIVFFLYRVVSFFLLLILVTFKRVLLPFLSVLLSTLFLCHLLSLTYLFDLFPFSLPASLFTSTLRYDSSSSLVFRSAFFPGYFISVLRLVTLPSFSNALFKQSSGRRLFAPLFLAIRIAENSRAQVYA